MAYFLGKDNPGNLADVLTGAYSMSSPSSTLPLNAGEPTTPANATTTNPNEDRAKVCRDRATNCREVKCQPYVGTATFGTCMKECMGDCAGAGPGNENPGPEPPPTTACPEGTGGTALEGCPCGTIYNTKTGSCAAGYKFVKRNNNGVRDDWAKEIAPVPGAVGTCECEKWVSGGGTSTKGRLGEYTYPAEMQQLMDLLLARGKEFLGMPTGLSQEAQDKQFGLNFENIRGAEAGQRNTLEQGLSRQGMLGTGAGMGMMNDLAWNTEGNIADTARDLFIQNELKKKQDLLDYSGAARDMMGTGMNFENLLESINAARRGEGANAMQAILAWLLAQQ